MIEFIKKQKHYFILFFVVVFGYWQVSFLFYALKWDLIDVVFPLRFYFSECIRSGYFPFWNPYQQTGTPFFADLQAPTYYPELLFTSLFGGYGIYSMHFFFIVYLFIAALGMYKLSFFFNKNRLASLMAGIAYVFSGYVVGHGQHFFLLVGVAWIPFVIKNYIELFQKRNIIQVLKTALFIFLMVSGAYQALSITLFYLLAMFFIFFMIKEIARNDKKAIFEIFKVNLFLFVIVVVLLLPLIVSTLEVVSSVNRLSEGVDPGQLGRYGQSIKTLISFLLPFSTLKYEYFGEIDSSMINHYFGLIPLLFFGLSILRKRTAIEYLILGFGLVIFASSFQVLPVRDFLFRFIPLMNLFKYAAYIRIFGLLAFIILAANYFSFFQKNYEKEKKSVLVSGICMLVVLLSIIVYSFGTTSTGEIKNTLGQSSWGEVLNEMLISQHVLFQAILQFVVIALFVALIIWRNKSRYLFHLAVLLLVIDLFTTTQLNMVVSVVDTNHKPSHMKKDLALLPEKFPIPQNGKVIFNDRQHVVFPPFWRNTYLFSKQISFNAFSSFELDSYNKLDDDYPNLRDAVLNNHLFYFSDTILSLNRFDDSKIDKQKSSKWLYLSDDDFRLLSSNKVETDITDIVVIKEFSPNKVVIETVTKNDQFLTMLQTNYKGWKAFVDNNGTPVFTSNFNYRTIFLPKGNHSVRFEYKNNKILFLYTFSNVFFFFIILFLIGYFIRERYKSGKVYLLIPLILLLSTVFFFVKDLSYKDENKKVFEIYETHWHNKKAVFTEQKNFEENILNIIPENEYVAIANIQNKKLNLKTGTLVVTLEIFPESYVEALIVSDMPGREGQENWHAAKIERQIENLGKWNKIIYYRNFYNLENDDEISVYLWNLNKCDFAIKDIEVSVNP